MALGGEIITYNLRRSYRARLMRLTVKRNGEIFLTLPYGMSSKYAERFITQKSHWISHTLDHFHATEGNFFLEYNEKDFLVYREKAKLLAQQRVTYYNALYGFKVHNITIRNQRSRWGSCSKRGNLNFNYKIALLPEALADYVIVHELCHLREFNHSKKFWNLVSLAIPNYKELKNKFHI